VRVSSPTRTATRSISPQVPSARRPWPGMQSAKRCATRSAEPSVLVRLALRASIVNQKGAREMSRALRIGEQVLAVQDPRGDLGRARIARPRRRTSVAALALLVSACGGATPSAPGSPPAPSALASLAPSSAGATPAATATAGPLPAGVIAFIPTAGGPIGLAATNGAIWVENHRMDYLSQIDPERNVEIARFPKVQVHCDIAAGGGYVWVTRAATSIVSKVDPASGDKLGTVGLRDACGIDVDDKDVWVASPGLGTVVRYDPATLAERASISVGPNP